MKGDVMIYIFLAPGFEEIEAIVKLMEDNGGAARYGKP